jgi:hypothetical protein
MLPVRGASWRLRITRNKRARRFVSSLDILLAMRDCTRFSVGIALAVGLLASALLTSAVCAQSRSAAGLNPRQLRLTTDSLEVYVVRQGERQRTGTIVDALDTMRVSGELRLERVYRRTDVVLGNGVDTLVDAFADLKLRLVDSRSEGGGVEHVEWRSGRVVGVVEQSGNAARQVDTAVTSGVYSSSSFDLILRASPLAQGYALTISTISGRQGATTVSAKVVASETLPRFGAAWRIEADLGGRSATYWIAKDSRRLVREIVHVTPAVDVLIIAR